MYFRCCFSEEGSFLFFVLFEVLDGADRRFPVGLKLGCSTNTGIWFYKSEKKKCFHEKMRASKSKVPMHDTTLCNIMEFPNLKLMHFLKLRFFAKLL